MKYKAPESKPNFYLGCSEESDYEPDTLFPPSPPDSPRLTSKRMTREQRGGLGASNPTCSFQPHVDVDRMLRAIPHPAPTLSPPKRAVTMKTVEEMQAMLQGGKMKEVKVIVRESAWALDDPIRGQLWLQLCNQHEASKTSLDGMYWDTVKQIFGTTDLPTEKISLPSFVGPQHLITYYLTPQGKATTDRIVTVVGYAYPDITFSPLLYPLACAMLHYMTEEECYECLLTLLNARHKRFLTQTKLLHEVTWRTAMQLTRKYAKASLAHLSRKLQSGEKLEELFQGWLWWIFKELPFPHLVRVMDCFLHEGNKVLYRVAMAVTILFWKQASRPDNPWAKELEAGGAELALVKFCQQMPASPDKLLRTAFTIRGLRSAEINRLFVKTEMCLKSKAVLSGSTQLVRAKSSENMPTSQSQLDIHMMSHTLTIREGKLSPGAKAKSMGVYPIQGLKSSALDKDSLLVLWSWLPVRITMYQPVLLYTTEEHGCSLTTFFGRVEHHEPTLLVAKTLNNEVFGAYCSTRWHERNCKDEHGNRQAYFGTGETFLFTLSPERKKFPWVGITQEKVDHAAELFMAADTRILTVGGGKGQAIWLDENLRFGKTEKCQTFDNPPLCSTPDFELKVLEVYGFASV